MKKEKIEVDRTDFDAFLKNFKELNEKYQTLFQELEIVKKSLVEKQISQSEPKVGAPEEDFAFWCAEIRFGVVEPIRIEEFRNKLESLMREYKIGQLNATILKKL